MSARAILAQVALAESRKNIQESQGTNNGPGIGKYWAATSDPSGYAERAPYCAAAVCWEVAEAQRLGVQWHPPLPKSAYCPSFLSWAQKQLELKCAHVFQADSQRFTAAPGDIICFLPKLSHIGIVVAAPVKGIVTTVEANTSPEVGDPRRNQVVREGGGVFQRQRSMNFGGWFIRLLTVGESFA